MHGLGTRGCPEESYLGPLGLTSPSTFMYTVGTTFTNTETSWRLWGEEGTGHGCEQGLGRWGYTPGLSTAGVP